MGSAVIRTDVNQSKTRFSVGTGGENEQIIVKTSMNVGRAIVLRGWKSPRIYYSDL